MLYSQTSIGRIAKGFDADLILLDADPLGPSGASEVLAHPQQHLLLVIKAGLVAASRLRPSSIAAGGGAGSCDLEGVNERLVVVVPAPGGREGVAATTAAATTAAAATAAAVVEGQLSK